MQVLLTGGAGYIGAHTVLELLQAGFSVAVADDFRAGHPEAVRRAARLAGREALVYPVDVADARALGEILDRHSFDAVIHFAGRKDVAESVREPLTYYRDNLDAALSVLECMDRAGVRRLIVSSSAAVYGKPVELPLQEDTPLGDGCSPYGWSKRMLEQMVCDHCAANPEWSAVLLRYFNPAGAHPSGQIGELPGSGLMSQLVQVAAGQLPLLQIQGGDYPTPDGTAVRDYLHVVDLAQGHVAALRYALDHPGAQTLNLGTGHGCSVRELADTFARVNGFPVPAVITARRPGDVPVCYASARKAEKLLHWRAERTYEQMCRDAWRWYCQNPRGYEEERQ